MEKADVLIRVLEPEIEKKCAEIRQKKNERLLTRIFAAAAIVLLILPTVLVFMGISALVIFAPFIFISAVFLAASPILMSKGAENYEQI